MGVAWCAELGAAFIEEVAEYAEEIAENLGLKNEERERFLRWATEFNAASHLKDSGGPHEFEATSYGRIKWASPLAEYVYINIDADERELPLLEILPSECQSTFDDVDADATLLSAAVGIKDILAGSTVHMRRADFTLRSRQTKVVSPEDFDLVSIWEHVLDAESDQDTDIDSDWDDVWEVDQSDDDIPLSVTTASVFESPMHMHPAKVPQIQFQLCTGRQHQID